MRASKLKWIAVFLLFIGCKNTTHQKIQSEKLPVMVDTFGGKASQINAKYLSTANYAPLYFGKLKDTVLINYELMRSYPFAYFIPPGSNCNSPKEKKRERNRNKSPYYRDDHYPHSYKSWKEANILVKIDTSRIIKNENIFVDLKIRFYEAYPVMLKNIDKDTIAIGYGEFIRLILEAKDSTNNWRSIEKDWTYGCGNDVGTLLLPPNEVVITSAMIYHGDFRTELRLRIGKNYSKAFKGSINKGQFKRRF